MSEMKTTALILVDVIDSFFKPGMPNYYPEVEQVLEPLRRLLAAARAGKHLVIHAAERHRHGLHDFEWHKLPHHHFIDEPDAAITPGFEMQGPNEVLVPKRSFSAFFATDLALLLTEQGIKHVVIAGVKTNVCIRATAQDAFANGFEPIVPREATNSNRPHLAVASLEDIERYMGKVVSLGDALKLFT
jgi:nicotinamidase-related amidase